MAKIVIDPDTVCTFVLSGVRVLQKALAEMGVFVTPNVKATVSRTGFNSRQQRLLQSVAQVITVRKYALMVGVSDTTARSDLNGLVSAGLFTIQKHSGAQEFVRK
jgi:hypothetical protein